MALYRYVPGKKDLLDAVVETLARGHVTVVREGDPVRR